jgi:hypothetical protein
MLKGLRKRTWQHRQDKEDRQDLQREHEDRIREIKSERAGKCLLGLLRSKPSTLKEKERRLKQIRVKHVLTIFGTYHK